jgi:Na+-driven multidrug efflux pump
MLVSFFSDTPLVISSGVNYLKCITPFYIPFAVMFCLNNSMRGAGESMFPLVDVLLSLILVRVPMVYWLADRFGSDYMYFGIGIGWCVGCLLSVLYYFSGRWKRHGSLADR